MIETGVPLRGHPNSISVEVHPDDLPGGPDELGEERADVAHTTPDVEDPHAGLDPGGGEDAAGQWCELAGLGDESVVFAVVATQRVLGVLDEIRVLIGPRVLSRHGVLRGAMVRRTGAGTRLAAGCGPR